MSTIKTSDDRTVILDSTNTKITTYSSNKYKTLWDAGSINKNPIYQRPYWYFDEDPNQWGQQWQKELICAFLNGEFIQPIHLRKMSDGTWEIIDGGHRSRTIMNFLLGHLKTINEFELEFRGKIYQIGGMNWNQIISEHPLLIELLNVRQFVVVEYYNMTDTEAEDKFLTLNDLHSMTAAEKRNSKRTNLANMVRNLGAVDKSPFSIFKTRNDKNKLLHISVESIKRATDEVVATIALWKYEGLDNYKKADAKELDKFYTDSVNSNSLDSKYEVKEPMYKDIFSLLQITEEMILGSDWKRKRWKKLTILKMSILIDYLSANKYVDFENSIIDWKEFCRKVDLVNGKTKMKHQPGQRYEWEWEGDKCSVIVKSLPKNPTDTEYGMEDTFGSGNRIDDIEFWLYNMLKSFWNEGMEQFGIREIKDRERSFKDNPKKDAWIEADGKCEECDKSVTLNEAVADHILPHSKGGRTVSDNLQILCSDCNTAKSNSFTTDDLQKFILKSGVKIDSDKIKKIAEIMHS